MNHRNRWVGLIVAAWVTTTATAQDNPLDPRPPARPGVTYPAWLRPGVRVTFAESSTTKAENIRVALPDENDLGASGFTQLTILAADERGVAAEMVSYGRLDGGPILQSQAFAGDVGGVDRFGEYWVHPAVLARTPDRNDAAGRVWRLKWQAGGREVDALAIMNIHGVNSTRHVYELSTGLLLSRRSENVAGSAGATTDTIVNVVLVNVRETKLPWQNSPPPAWVRKGGKLVLEGTFAFVSPNGAMPPGQLRQTFTFGEPGAGYVPAEQTNEQLSVPGGPVERSAAARCFGPASGMPLWIDPRSVRDLKPGQTLDADPVTKFTLKFLGTQNGAFHFCSENAGERLFQSFDERSGALAGMAVQRKTSGGSTDISLRAAIP